MAEEMSESLDGQCYDMNGETNSSENDSDNEEYMGTNRLVLNNRRFSKNIVQNSTEESLLNDLDLLRYLLFSFILSNDTLSMRDMLSHMQQLPYKCLWISKAQVAKFENELYDGICENKTLKSLYEKCLSENVLSEQECTNQSRQTVIEQDFSSKSSSGNVYLNLFELSCLLVKFYQTSEMLELLVNHMHYILDNELYEIVCNVNIDVQTVTSLVNYVTSQRDVISLDEAPTGSEVYCTTLVKLTKYCVNQTNKRCRFLTFNKIREILATLEDISFCDDITYGKCVQLCMREAVINQDSALLCCFPMSYNRKHKSQSPFDEYLCCRMHSVMLENILRFAYNTKAYYIIHILHGLEQLSDVTINNHPLKSQTNQFSDDLYLQQYLLSKNAINFHIEQRRFGNVLCDPEQFLSYWLLCCYDNNRTNYITRCSFKNTSQNLDFLCMAIRILCRLGADIDCYDILDGRNALFKAVDSCNLSAVRALIVNDCDVNAEIGTPRALCVRQRQSLYSASNATRHALRARNYAILKVLLVCGAEKPEKCRSHAVQLQPNVNGKYTAERLWLIHWLQQPHSLAFYCRKSLRQTLRNKLTLVLENIQYPKALKDFIHTKQLI